MNLDAVYFLPIGQSLWAFVVAIFGGSVGGGLFGLAQRRREDEARIAHLRRFETAPLSVPEIVAISPETARDVASRVDDSDRSG